VSPLRFQLKFTAARRSREATSKQDGGVSAEICSCRRVTGEMTAGSRAIGPQPALTILLLAPAAIVPAGSYARSKTMNSLPVDHTPSNTHDSATSPAENDLRNPLWIIAIGMACFFGTAVIVMSTGWA
jgi:hypothetical protein